MKQTENNDIDLLLRALARSEGARSVSSEGHSTMHLDADELNSYAEQALPAATRARYTSHLADCASCRKIISELASASHANVGKHSISQESSAGFWQKFGALLSPGLLRYAAPALALFAFIVVGLVVVRQNSQSDFVAQNQPTVSRDATTETKKAFDSPTEPANSAGTPASSAAIEDRRAAESQSSAGKTKDNQAKADETSKITTPTDSLVATDRDTSPRKAAGVVASPSYAPEPAPPAPKPQTTSPEARSEVAARQKEEANKKDEPAREQEGSRARTDSNQNEIARSQPSTGGALANQSQERLHKLEAKRASGAGAKANDDEADIRSVSGRRFRRQGGIWVDTAYQSSMSTTTLARGSEQFRALVADEPGIRAIAAQLDGEVVVIWKGRAYRIR